MGDAKVGRIRIYPIKGFGGVEVEEARILDAGTLAYDREFALHNGEEIVNGKIAEDVHGFGTALDTETDEITVEAPSGDAVTIPVNDDGGRELQDWFEEADTAFDSPDVLRDGDFGFVDRRDRLASVSVVSTATLHEVASWFDGIDPDGVRRRLRTNVEVSGVPAFWEDRFVGGEAPALEVEGVRLEGAEPCARCVVPTRDPETGEATDGFRETFLKRRRETFPDFADEEAFDHLYTVTLIARVAEGSRGSTLRVGDSVRTADTSEGRGPG